MPLSDLHLTPVPAYCPPPLSARKPYRRCPGCGGPCESVGWYAATYPGHVYEVTVPEGGSDPGGVTACRCPACGERWAERRTG